MARDADDYQFAVAFIESGNRLSRAVHERLGWTEIGTFDIGERTFSVRCPCNCRSVPDAGCVYYKETATGARRHAAAIRTPSGSSTVPWRLS